MATDWQERVIDEEIELSSKIKKLRKYLDKLPESSAYALLWEQYYAMTHYHEILLKRIGEF